VPNRRVDVDSWRRSACYPRSTFYPLSNGATTSYRWITYACFRTCSTCKSRSQAPFYVYALRTIADRAEGTIALLRYILGGNRPSQTDPLALSPTRFHGRGLEFRLTKTGISLLAPRALTSALRCLPAMLHIINQNPTPDYSKGSQGLSVLLRESGIFTGATTSPRSSLRQRPDRYTIRAGRNLPDKEFRYLRTVIVTADIHRSFGSELLSTEVEMTPRLNFTALVTCHTLYILLRVSRVLCF